MFRTQFNIDSSRFLGYRPHFTRSKMGATCPNEEKWTLFSIQRSTFRKSMTFFQVPRLRPFPSWSEQRVDEDEWGRWRTAGSEAGE